MQKLAQARTTRALSSNHQLIASRTLGHGSERADAKRGEVRRTLGATSWTVHVLIWGSSVRSDHELVVPLREDHPGLHKRSNIRHVVGWQDDGLLDQNAIRPSVETRKPVPRVFPSALVMRTMQASGWFMVSLVQLPSRLLTVRSIL